MNLRSLTFVLLTFAALTISVFSIYGSHPALFDDAFITFRYSASVLAGEGFVFNPEDGHVEGFTNLLWVILNAFAIRLGQDPVAFSQSLGLVSLGLSLCLFFDFNQKPVSFGNLAALLWSIGLLSITGFVQTAGSGLETSFAGLLIVIMASLVHGAARVYWLWVCGGLLLLTRPDGAIFLVATAIALSTPADGICLGRNGLAWVRASVGRALTLVVGFVLPVIGLTIARLVYFGYPFPNTYYAKMADKANWVAGLEYWKAFTVNSPQIVAIFGVWLIWVLVVRRKLTRLDVFGLVGLVGYATYVAKVGGDFMYYRFAFQVLPLLAYVVVRASDDAALPTKVGSIVVAAGVAIGGFLVPSHMEEVFGMQSIETMNSFVGPGREVGMALRERLPRTARISTTLAGTVPFYSRLFAVDEWGLNDRNIAHRPSSPIPEKGRGHSKRVESEYLIARAVDFEIGHPTISDCRDFANNANFPQVMIPISPDRCLRTRFRSRSARMIQFVCNSDFPRKWVDCSPLAPPDYAESAPLRASAEVDAVRVVDEPMELSGALKQAKGVAFGDELAVGALAGQQAVSIKSPHLNSFHGGDETKGWLEIPLPPSTRRVALEVGGSSDCANVYVALVSGGKIVRKVCGHNSETAQSEVLSVDSLTEPAALLVVDNSSANWGHILVSNVVVTRLNEAQRALREHSPSPR